jgi:hypothetical protein
MSVPLRKDEFDTEELTTADLAQGKRPAAAEDRPPTDTLKNDSLKTDLLKENGPRPVLASRPSTEGTQTIGSDLRETKDEARNEIRNNEVSNELRNSTAAQNSNDSAPLFPNNELEELRNRWSGVQTAFVDEPRRAVEQADGLVASAMKRLAEVFADERSKLEKQWDRGDDVSTEDLRIALQRYRSFFQRLLAI